MALAVARLSWVPVALTACNGSGNKGATSPSDASPRDGASLAADTEAPPSEAGSPGADANAPTATVHFLGRFDTRDPKGPRFAWPGSAIAATFTGTGISIQLHDAGTNYFTVVVDGGVPTVVPTTSAADTYTLASGLAAGTHTLVLTKRTESYVGIVQFFAFAPMGGALVPSPDPFTRRIEYIGDSITCGYGDLGAGPSCHFGADTEDETAAYGALAAAQVGAQQTVVAYSGIGVVRDGNGGTTNQMPVRFGLTLADDPTSTWGFGTPPPGVVVLNLGTNDFAHGDPGTAFQTAYVAFVEQVRTHYANAHIICALSPMLADPDRSRARTYIQQAVSQVTAAGDARVTYLEFDQQLPSDGYGCDYHPSAPTQQKMAAKLVPALKSLAGW